MLGKVLSWNAVFAVPNWPQDQVATPDAAAAADVDQPALGIASTTTDLQADWRGATALANQAKAFIAPAPSVPAADETGIAETSQAFRDRVAEAIATGLGDQMTQSDGQLVQLLHSVVAEKLKLASNCGLQKNIAGQVRLLLSAFGDIEWFIGTILSNFSGMQLPPEAQNLILNLRKLQSTIMNKIREATGLNLSDDEMKALLEKDPSQAQQNINLNWLIQQDKNLSPRLPDNPALGTERSGSESQADLPTGKSIQDEMVYGSRSNPAKRHKNLGTARQKMLQELKKIMTKVQSLAQGPKSGALLSQLSELVQRGLAICMLAGACEDLSSGDSKSSAEVQQAQALFQQVLPTASPA